MVPCSRCLKYVLNIAKGHGATEDTGSRRVLRALGHKSVLNSLSFVKNWGSMDRGRST